MNETLTTRILEYLNQNTNYAVIITGKYGIGKTYYIDNILKPKILEIQQKEKSKLKFIRISLFGISTIEEIQKNIFIEFYSGLKLDNKRIKFFGGILKGVVNYLGVNIDEILKDTEITSLNNYENVVLCFDDIDRRSSDLKLTELYGFINDLVENRDAKIILIANEDTLIEQTNQNEKDSYSILKEKVIGITLPFHSNQYDIINSIIDTYKNDVEYHNFLKEKSAYIVKMVSKKDNNLRNVIFFLEHFKSIFTEVRKIIDGDEKLQKIQKEILDDILKFTLPIIFEYKLGRLCNKNLKLLRDYFNSRILRWLDNDREKDYIDEFVNQYDYDEWKNKQFNSILNYVVGQEILKIENLKSEIQNTYQVNIAELSEKEQIFRILNGGNYWNFMKLDYDNYLQKLKDLIRLIDENQILLDEYAKVFHYIVRLENPLKQDIVELKNKIIEKINTNDYEYNNRLDTIYFNHKPFGEKYAEYFKEIIETCLKRNEEIKKNEKENELNELFREFEDNPEIFFEEKVENILDKPFFAVFDFERYWTIIDKMSNYNKTLFGYFITQRYKRGIYPDIKNEKDFIEQLNIKLEEKIRNGNINVLEKEALKFIISKINEILPNFEI